MKFLCEYNFDVHYIKGKDNIAADALSRLCHELTSMVIGKNLRECIMHHLPKDEFYAEFSQVAYSQRPCEGKFADYSLDLEGLLQHKGHIYIPSIGDLREFFILEAHQAPYAAHLGVKKLHADLRHLYHWPGMRM